MYTYVVLTFTKNATRAIIKRVKCEEKTNVSKHYSSGDITTDKILGISSGIK